ncbi:MAG: hypothetical protein HZA34_02345 [Candidatus Pacebacteria bacterium]|nr:hypothetical protein [Candidatus Paceibacterota bacterium]
MKLLILLVFFFVFPSITHAYFTTFETLLNNTVSVLDWIPPQTFLYIQSPTNEQKHIEELIINNTFDADLTGWETSGHIFIPEKGVVQLGSKDDTTEGVHTLRQTIPSTAQALTFSYRIGTQETLEGFDDPAFVVTLNTTPVFSASWKDASENWRTASINLSEFSDPILILQFSVQNTGDALNPTWVQLKNITTNIGLVNTTQKLSFSTSDAHPTQTYTQESSDALPQLYRNPFSFTQTLEKNMLHFWSIDQENNNEIPQEKSIFFNQTPPPPFTILSLDHQPHDEYVFTIANEQGRPGNQTAYTLHLPNQNIHPFALDYPDDHTERLFFRFPPNHIPTQASLEYRDSFGNTAQKENILL